MILYDTLKRVGLKFYAQDAAGGGSGASASGAAGAQDFKTPLDDLPLDELDPKLKDQLTKARDQVIATLQKNKADSDKLTTDLRGFQSTADKLKQELQEVKAKLPADTTEDQFLKAARETLIANKFKPEDVESMSPTFADMLRKSSKITSDQIQKQLGPLAAVTISTNAKASWDSACQNDSLGMLKIPEVANKVWDVVKEQVAKGNIVNDGFIINLAKQEYVNHTIEQKKAGKDVTLPDNPPNPVMRTSPVFFGTASDAIVSPPADPNAAKTKLNEDTNAALARTFSEMGKEQKIYPKAYAPAGGK